MPKSNLKRQGTLLEWKCGEQVLEQRLGVRNRALPLPCPWHLPVFMHAPLFFVRVLWNSLAYLFALISAQNDEMTKMRRVDGVDDSRGWGGGVVGCWVGEPAGLALASISVGVRAGAGDGGRWPAQSDVLVNTGCELDPVTVRVVPPRQAPPGPRPAPAGSR